MEFDSYTIKNYIDFFFSRIVGFSRQKIEYLPMSNDDSEFLSIAMDKVDRLNRKGGRLRNRVWSNCYFIIHNGDVPPSKIYQNKIKDIKKNFPFLFIRSYVYFVFIDASKSIINNISKNQSVDIEKKDYKIWIFNSKYQVQEETRRTNLFGIKLNDNEIVDDYMYLSNPIHELQRIKAANSDAIDCVRAFTGDLELLEQTSNMLEVIYNEFNENPNARIIVEGPARSGKTIIAATLLGKYENSKFLLMNYFFYQAIIDGFHALSGWTAQEIEDLVKNPELDLWISINKRMPKILSRISENLKYAIIECENPKNRSQTKAWLMENIRELTKGFEEKDFRNNNLPIFESLIRLNNLLANTNHDKPFVYIEKSKLIKMKEIIDSIVSGKIKDLELLINKIIVDLIANSKQRFYHHNINKNISDKVTQGCWIERGVTTVSKMWTASHHPQLIICDEVQRLGFINKYMGYDEFDEVTQILNNSDKSFFTGDNFQMLNSKYDQGIDRISSEIKKLNQSLIKHQLPESVGVPAEIGILMKYLTNPDVFEVDQVINNWSDERAFDIIFIKKNTEKLISIFDDDVSSKKHFASPMDYDWLEFDELIQIKSTQRQFPVISLSGHERKDFSYKFPYFCNEEIMPNYILSAYELISREVESLYVHIPYFAKKVLKHEDWYRKHLYVLFTRPTSKLVVNFDVNDDFNKIKKMVESIKYYGAKVSVEFIET